MKLVHCTIWVPIAMMACYPEPATDTSALSQLLEQHDRAPIGSLRAVVFISENGCVVCNRALSALIKDNLADPDVVIVLEATGSVLDISPFLGPGSHQVVRDFEGGIRRTGLLDGSGAILLANGAVESTIELSAARINEQLDHLRAWLEDRPRSAEPPS